MFRRRRSTMVLILLTGLTSASNNVLQNIAAGVLPDFLRPYLWTAWPLVVVFMLVGVVISIRVGERDLSQLVELVVQRKSAAEDWKQLHEQCQGLNHELAVFRAFAWSSNPSLVDFELSWDVLGDELIQFTRLEHLVDGLVRGDMKRACEQSRWFPKIVADVNWISSVLSECYQIEDLRDQSKELEHAVWRLQIVMGEILKFLDRRLQMTIRQLDRDLESVRTGWGGSHVAGS